MDIFFFSMQKNKENSVNLLMNKSLPIKPGPILVSPATPNKIPQPSSFSIATSAQQIGKTKNVSSYRILNSQKSQKKNVMSSNELLISSEQAHSESSSKATSQISRNSLPLKGKSSRDVLTVSKPRITHGTIEEQIDEKQAKLLKLKAIDAENQKLLDTATKALILKSQELQQEKINLIKNLSVLRGALEVSHTEHAIAMKALEDRLHAIDDEDIGSNLDDDYDNNSLHCDMLAAVRDHQDDFDESYIYTDAGADTDDSQLP